MSQRTRRILFVLAALAMASCKARCGPAGEAPAPVVEKAPPATVTVG